MAFDQAGLQLIAENVNGYIGAINQSNSATNNFYGTLNKAGGVSGAFGQVMVGALRRVGEIAVNALGQAAQAVGGFLRDAVTDAGTFEQGLNVLQAVTGATDQQMQAISKTAIQLGNDIALPGTSAQDAATAMTELAKAGLSTQDAMDAARGTLLLATAAETDAGNAAEITAGALNAFHLSGNDAVKVADLLAAAANASAASITDLSQGLQQGGFMFNATGQKVDDLVASLAILTNVGLTGSDAGTALKNAMVRLIDPTEKAKDEMRDLGLMTFDTNKAIKALQAEGIVPATGNTRDLITQVAQLGSSMGLSGAKLAKFMETFDHPAFYDAAGKMLPFRDVIDLLNKSMSGLTDEEKNNALSTIFLSDGMKAMIPLLAAGGAGFDAMKAKVNQAGAAQGLAGAQTMGFTGATAALGNSLDTLKLIIGTQLLPLLTPLINQVAAGVSTFGTMIQAVLGNKDALAQLSPELQGIVGYISSVVSAFSLWQVGTISLRTALATIYPGLGQIASVIETAVAAFQSGGTASTTFGSALMVAGGIVQAWWTNVRGVFAVVQQYIPAVMTAVGNVVNAVLAQINTFWQANGAEILAFIGPMWATIQDIYQTATALILEIVTGTLQLVAEFITAHGTQIQTILSGAWQIISGVIAAALTLIQGLLHAALAVMHGDWQGAWTAIQNMSTMFVQNIWRAIQGFLNIIAAGFNTSLSGIVQTWAGNWEMLKSIASRLIGNLVDLIMSLPGQVAGVGSAAVSAISSGFSNAWSSFIASVRRKLDELKAMLPFSEPRDHSSPLYGLKRSGAAIIKNLQEGINRTPLYIGAPMLPGSVAPGGISAWAHRVGAPMGTMQMGNAGNVANYQHTTNINMPVYTNQSPNVLRSSLAIAGAALP